MELSKIGHHFRKWNDFKMTLSKNVNNKKVLLNLHSSMKKNQKDLNEFWHRKLTLKVRICHILKPLCYSNLQNSMISFDCSWCLAKTFFLYHYLENSTTDIAIRYRISLKQKNICQMTAITNCNVLIISRFFFFRSEQLIKSNKFKCFKRYYKMRLPRFAL